jgi:hypothetical protein
MFYAEIVKKLLLVTFILGFESLWLSFTFFSCAFVVVLVEPVDRMVDWYQAPGPVDRAIWDKLHHYDRG